MPLTENEKANIQQYSPADRIVDRAERTKVRAGYLRDKIQTFLRSNRHDGSYGVFLKKVGEFSQVACANDGVPLDAGYKLKASPDQLSGFMGSGEKADIRINEEDFAAITFFLDFHGAYETDHRGQEIADEFPDPVFHGLLHFLSLGDITLSSLKGRAPGWYRAYRPSSTFPGNYWVGLLEVFNAPTGAVSTREFYQSDGFDGRPNRVVTFSGYLIRKGRHHSMLSRSDTANSLCLVLLPSVAIQDNEIMSMGGALIDISTGNLWGGKVLYERMPDPATDTLMTGEDDFDDTAYRDEVFERLKADCCVTGRDNVPQSIVDYFAKDGLTLY